MLDNIPEIFKELHKVKQSSQIAEDLRGRIVGSKLGVVVDNNDPDGLRRIKVQFDFMPKGVNSYWVMRVLDTPHYDPAVPEVGQTVVVDFINGDVSKGVYRCLQNLVNPSHEVKEDELVDDSLIVKGNKYTNVAGLNDIKANSEVKDVETSIETSSNTNSTTTDTSYSVDAGTSISTNSTLGTTIQAGTTMDVQSTAPMTVQSGSILNIGSAGATTLTSGGALAIGAPAVTITVGGVVVASIGSDGSINFATNNINFTVNNLTVTGNMDVNGSVEVLGSGSINGKSIAVIGGSVNTSGGSGTITSSGQ